MLAEVERHLADVTHAPEIEAKNAEAVYENAKLDREIAEIAKTEYEEGIYVQDHQTILGEIALAKADLQRAKERLDWAETMKQRGRITESELISERLSHEKAMFTKEQAETKLEVLEKYTRPTEIRKLTTEVAKLKAEEEFAQAKWGLAKMKVQNLRKESARIGSTVSETHVATLLGQASSLQAEVVTLLDKLPPSQPQPKDGLTVEQARRAAADVAKTIDEAKKLEEQARGKLADALKLAQVVQRWREELRDTYAQLIKAREDLKRLEKLVNAH